MTKNRRTIAELLQLNMPDLEDIKYTCEGKLTAIDTTYGWWYKACYDCKGAVKAYGDTFWCARCGKNDWSPVPWYKLNVIVEDESISTNFIIFGKLAQNIIRVPTQQLAVANNSDKFLLPPIIKSIIGQTYIFEVSINSLKSNLDARSFKVSKFLSTGLDINGKYKEHQKDVQSIYGETDEITIACESQTVIHDEMGSNIMLQST
ncbi:uncharacterized protein LOC109716703 [Ananas comosus]|uniref:Uncharacterized protein LOC109716703 n=1 Tax=Ananas comosus TaxID=4615 RepID=A0A6P5FNE7_ANACO|nr:uncharacterized protein LOC109716703 [Ananas comosus]